MSSDILLDYFHMHSRDPQYLSLALGSCNENRMKIRYLKLLGKPVGELQQWSLSTLVFTCQSMPDSPLNSILVTLLCCCFSAVENIAHLESLTGG